MSAGVSRVGSLFLDEIPAELDAWLAAHVSSTLWGAIETGTKRAEGPVWFVVTTARNALAAVGSGRYWEDVAIDAPTEAATRLARVSYRVGGEEVFVGARIGASDLGRLFDLAFRPRAEGLLEAARDHYRARRFVDAAALLEHAEAALTPGDRAGEVAYLSLEQRIHIEQAACAMQLGSEGDAVVTLASVSDDRVGDDLLRATSHHHEVPGWLVTLALAHEEAGQPRSAARVYARLHEESPREHRLVLAEARALRRAGDLEEASGAYDRYLAEFESTEVRLEADDGDASSVAEAMREAAETHERLGRTAQASSLYVDLIRRAPFDAVGYERLFALRDDATSERIFAAQRALSALDPKLAATIGEGLSHGEHRTALLRDPEPIDDETHDRVIVHPTEKVTTTLAQRWIGSLTRDERDTRDIEHHAQPVSVASHPEAWEVLVAVAKLAGVPRPRAFLSHGSAGVEVLGTTDPLILLGACHVDPADPRCLTRRQLAFALGTQVEHIRAEHVLLTSTEFWRTFGTKSATTLLALLPMGDLVSRLTDGPILRWIEKLGKSNSPALRSVLEIVERRVRDGATGEGVQSAYSATLARLRSVTDEPTDHSSLVKERLADFARAAQYTADRVGLLAADDVEAALMAMVLVSPTMWEHADRLREGGLVAFLAAVKDDPAREELVLRIAELLRFALSDDFAALRNAVR